MSMDMCMYVCMGVGMIEVDGEGRTYHDFFCRQSLIPPSLFLE